MKFTLAIFSGLAALTLATPLGVEKRNTSRGEAPYIPCPPDTINSVAECCSTNVLDLADLSCTRPKDTSSPEAFKKSCSEDSNGKAAKCCTVDLLGVCLKPPC